MSAPTAGTTPTAGRERLPVAALSVLAMLGFLLISAETMPTGVLPQVAEGLATSEGVVGQLVSAYALGTVVVTVPAIVLTRGIRRKRLLLAGLVAFLLANTVVALSSGVVPALVARFVGGGLSGMLWGMLAGYAVRLSPPSLAGRALSLVAVGAPVGIAFGTPLGAWLGTTFGWRWSFGGLSVLSAVVLVLAVALVPDAPGQGSAARLPLLRVLRLRGVVPVLAVIFFWMLGNTTAYTYVAPYLRAGGSGVSVEVLLLVFGLASIGGIALTAALVDLRPRSLLVTSLVVFSLSGLVLVVGHASPMAVYAAVLLWGLAFGGASPQLQRPLTAAGGADADVANSFLPVAFNLAIFAAGVLGALLLGTAGPVLVPLTITVAGAAALAVAVSSLASVYPRTRPGR